MPSVVQDLIGQPKRTEHGGDTWRYGNQGSLVVHIGGDHPGTWRDHESGVGGGTLALVGHLLQSNRSGALDWLRNNGYISTEQASTVRIPQSPQVQARVKAEEQARKVRRQQGYARAAVQAQEMVKNATFEPHPYLDAKGFPGKSALVLDGKMIVPMRDYSTGEVCAVQAIDADGGKKFQPGGCRAMDTVHVIGPPRSPVEWFCEGYATGLSIRAALQSVSRDDRVVVCFSSGQLASLAGRRNSRALVCCDHDWWRCRHPECKTKWDFPADQCPECELKTVPPAGETAARKSGRPWWQPDVAGYDANDVYREEGVRVLANHLLELLRGSMHAGT